MYNVWIFIYSPLYLEFWKTGMQKKNAFFYSSGNLKQQKLNLNVSNIQIKAG